MAQGLCRVKRATIEFCFAVTFLSLYMSHILTIPTAFAAEVSTIGIIGIDTSVRDENGTNMDAYIDMKDISMSPLEFANKTFLDEMNAWLQQEGSKYNMEVVDLTEKWDKAVNQEMFFQLTQGDPTTAVKAFTIPPDYIMHGHIAKFSVTHRESLGGNNIAVEVRLTVRVTDTKTGKIVFVGIGNGKANNHDVDISSSASKDKISEYGWSLALEMAMKEIMKQFAKEV